MKVGIDRLSFYIPSFYLDLKDLATHQSLQEAHYTIKTGQHKMAVPAPNEDIVTMAANAADMILKKQEDKDAIRWLFFATETGIDQSKAAGMYLHHLLDLPANCRVIELKQACYGGTAALQLTMDFLRNQPENIKALLVGADIARYELGTLPESSQGAGAAAMLLSHNPKILAIEPEAGYYAQDAMDFWRPNYRTEALVNGKLSCDLYLKGLKESWIHYQTQSRRDFSEHQGFCYHVPIPRLAEKGHQKLARQNGLKLSHEETTRAMNEALKYAREIGNCYTASLYMSFAAWLDQENENLVGKRVGLYSYGSGATAEYFSGIVQPDYKLGFDAAAHQKQIAQREGLTYQDYTDFFNASAPQDGRRHLCSNHPSGKFSLDYFDQHQRFYKKNDDA